MPLTHSQNPETAPCAYRVNTGCVALLDGDNSGLEVCGLMGSTVDGVCYSTTDGAGVLVFMTVGKLHAPLLAGSCA